MKGTRNAGDANEVSESRETVVDINRCAKVMKGGRQFSFSVLAVCGDGKGMVGFGMGKAKEVPIGVEKAMKVARKSLVKISLKGDTIPHEIIGRFGASRVFLSPASKGTGIVAGQAVRAVVEACGIKDILTKALGSVTPVNLVKATMEGLKQLKTKEEIEKLRGVEIEF